MAWIRQPQENPGDYWFAGKFFVTRGVFDEIPTLEVADIVRDVQEFAQQEQGADYLQVYINNVTGRKIWVIDQVTKNELQEGIHPEEHNYFTVLFPEEY